MNEIILIDSQKEIMEHYRFIKKIPTIDITHETMLARCLTGEYKSFSFRENNEPVGIMLIRDLTPVAFITGVCLENKTKYFLEKGNKCLKNLGFTYVKAASKIPQDRFEGFSGFKKLWSVYGKEL